MMKQPIRERIHIDEDLDDLSGKRLPTAISLYGIYRSMCGAP
jgi:hypothetical protein